MVHCANCGKKLGTFEDTAKDKEDRDVCMNCKKVLDEQEIQRQKLLKDLDEQEKLKEKKELEKKMIKDYGGKFQADVIKELTGVNSNLQKIRSYSGWVLAIIVIEIIIGCIFGFIIGLRIGLNFL